MIAPTRYFDLVREMKNAYNHRLRLVESAKQRGIKPTAQLFATTVPTVRKWLRRYQQRGPSCVRELFRAPHQQSQKTSAALEAQLVELRKTLPTFGARRLIREFDLPISHGALERIWRQQGLMPKRRRKYQRKQDLAHNKAQWAGFQQISADTKDLDDIPHYWAQAQRLGLPIVQYTARDVRSGLLFWSFAEKRSAAASAVFASRIQQHLDRYGVSLRDLVWQTDNGGEFKGDFPKALGDSQHVRIPPAAHTYQSDVETVHRLEEDEFFDLEDFVSRGDFLAKVHTYQLYFNLVRPNSHKEFLSPWQIIERLAPRSPLQLCLLPPVFLDYHLNDSGGYDVPRLPYVDAVFWGTWPFLLLAMFLQESKNVTAPDGDPRIRKTVAFLRRPAKCRINLHLEGVARLFHRGRKGPARRKIVIILGLKKENRRARMAHRAQHHRLQFGGFRPALRPAGRVACRAI